MKNAETQLANYFAMYEPAMARFGKALRAKLRRRLPGLFEVVYLYEKQRALVISYSPSTNGYEGLCSMGLYPHEVKLFFAQGAHLSKADPNRLLQGRSTVRHVVLGKPADFDHPEIEALLTAALKLTKVRLAPGTKGEVVIRAEAQKQRAARTSQAARPATADRKPKVRR